MEASMILLVLMTLGFLWNWLVTPSASDICQAVPSGIRQQKHRVSGNMDGTESVLFIV